MTAGWGPIARLAENLLLGDRGSKWLGAGSQRVELRISSTALDAGYQPRLAHRNGMAAKPALIPTTGARCLRISLASGASI